MFKVCACEECDNAHSRVSKYCSDRCRNRQKKINRLPILRERRRVDHEWAEKQREKARRLYHDNGYGERRRAKIKQRKESDPVFAEDLRRSERERKRIKRENDNEYVEKQKQYHRDRYANDPEYRDGCRRRAAKSRARKKALKMILKADEASTKLGERND